LWIVGVCMTKIFERLARSRTPIKFQPSPVLHRRDRGTTSRWRHRQIVHLGPI